ncbi:MAG TPA: amidohydrolase family protein [Woeseiaceae bacterium]
MDAAPSGETLAMDLLGTLWLLDADGGAAEPATAGLQPARRPHWSPDGERLLFQSASAFGSRIGVVVPGEAPRWLDDGRWFDQHPDWHPDGERIVFSSERRASGFDLWEMELATGQVRRLTRHAGDETEPAWSPDGEALAWIAHADGEWRLVVKPRDRPERDLVRSDEPLAAPAWRPDGTLITCLRGTADGYRLEMVLLSEPPVLHTLATGQDFFLAPASWLDRERLVYTADGVIKERSINAWQAEEIPFRAEIGTPGDGPAARPAALALEDAPANRLLIHAPRLFDGMRAGYRENMDVLIEGGRIASVEPHAPRENLSELDLGDVTVLPGYIDAWTSLPPGSQASAGLELLSYGITTVVASGVPDLDPTLWESEAAPGPRLLFALPASERAEPPAGRAPVLVTVPAAGSEGARGAGLVRYWHARGVPVLAESWNLGFRLGADLFLGIDMLPASPRGRQYQDVRLAMGSGPLTMLSGLADAATPGLEPLFASRQASYWSRPYELARRYAVPPALAPDSGRVAVGSKPNGFPAGLATHAELAALAAAGLGPDEVLWAAGRNAARALGLEDQAGRIAPGALADLVLVAGDPRARITDSVAVVAVVRNGRFFSVAGLLDRASAVE